MTPALLVLAIKITSAASAGSGDLTLAQLLACHDSAVGGPALRAVQRQEYRISIEEGGATLRGRYRATRDGRMRIDVFADSIRVFSEGWDGQHGWELAQGAAAPTPTSSPATATLWHGLAQPGHLWTLADMKRNGHAVALAGRETIEATSYLRGHANAFRRLSDLVPARSDDVSNRAEARFSGVSSQSGSPAEMDRVGVR